MSDALKPCPFCGLPPEIEDHEDGCFRIDHWCNDLVLDNFIAVEDETREKVKARWNRRADLVPAPSVTVKTAAKHLLTIWDRWMASDDAGPDAAFLMLQSACFAAQAYQDAASNSMTADSAPGQMLRALLIGLIDLSSPELDHLRACNRPSPKRATPEALTSLRAGEGFATSGAEDRWIEDMKAGVYDEDARQRAVDAAWNEALNEAAEAAHEADSLELAQYGAIKITQRIYALKRPEASHE